MKSPARSATGCQGWLRPCAPDRRRERRGDGEGRPGTDAALGGHAGRARRLGPDPGARTARPARRAQPGRPPAGDRPHCWPSSCARRSACCSSDGGAPARLRHPAARWAPSVSAWRPGWRPSSRPAWRRPSSWRSCSRPATGGGCPGSWRLPSSAWRSGTTGAHGAATSCRRSSARWPSPAWRPWAPGPEARTGRWPSASGSSWARGSCPRSRTCEPRSCACTGTPLRRG